MNSILIFSLFVLILNIPFGYWRSNVNKFSLQWLLAIHLPIPFIIAARLFTEIGFELYTFLFSVTAYFCGQVLGNIIFNLRQKLNLQPLTSCLVMDVLRGWNNN